MLFIANSSSDAKPTKIYPALAMEEYARILFILVCANAITLPNNIVSTARIANKVLSPAGLKPIIIGTSVPTAATFHAVDIRPVTIVGAPS